MPDSDQGNSKIIQQTSLSVWDALSLVSGFFEKEWAQTDVDNVIIKPVTGGLVNTLYLVSRDNTAHAEPAAVLIRYFGISGEVEEPPGGHVVLSAAQQAIVYWEMSRRGWGPSVYGFFPGGRLEEYIDSHTLTAAESGQPAARRDVARSYARMHSLQLPLRKDGFEMVVSELSQCVKKRHERALQMLRAIEDPRAREYAAVFRETDWELELHWVSDLFKKHNCKRTITHGDANYLNIVVKNSKSGCKIVLIDYETISYSYRGFDIGGHFAERMYCYNQPDDHLTGYTLPNDDEQRLFCEAYLQELRHLGQRLTEQDTVDHLVLEGKVGRLYQYLWTNLMCTVFNEEVEKDPVFLADLTHMMGMYSELRKNLRESGL